MLTILALWPLAIYACVRVLGPICRANGPRKLHYGERVAGDAPCAPFGGRVSVLSHEDRV
jgi:hypothetical protein